MNNFSQIYYTDAYYILEEVDILSTTLPRNEAFGILEDIDDEKLIIHFIKKITNVNEQNKNSENGENEKIIKGLVLPKCALLDAEQNYIKGINDVETGQTITFEWIDMVFVENDKRNDISRMYTEGIVFKNNHDHIVIKNPETIRISPLPIKNHPAIKPAYYVIPKAFIQSFKIL